MKGGVLCARGRERPGALSFKLGPGSHYLPNQHSHNVKQQTNSGLLRTPYARRNREVGGGGAGAEKQGETLLCKSMLYVWMINIMAFPQL